MKRFLLDSSFLIDLLNEIADDSKGPALAWLQRKGASDARVVKSYLSRYMWQGIHRVHAEKVALRQKRSRRMGENDAWQCAPASTISLSLKRLDIREPAHSLES